MSKELQIASGNLPEEQKTAQANMSQTGDGNTQIGYVNNYDGSNYNYLIVTGAQNAGGASLPGAAKPLNLDYYNLFVIGDEPFDSDHFIVPLDRALTESMTPESRDAFSALSEEAIEDIKTFPALFASENHQYGHTDDQHLAFYGLVTQVKKQDNGVKIHFQKLNPVPQQKLNEIAFELGLGRASSFNELNRTHWAIKKINLVEVLREAGIRVFVLS